MKLAPDARQDDGLFDVVLIGDVNKLDFLTTAPKLYTGRYLSHPKVELLRSSTVVITAAEALPLEVDGRTLAVNTSIGISIGDDPTPAKISATSAISASTFSVTMPVPPLLRRLIRRSSGEN